MKSDDALIEWVAEADPARQVVAAGAEHTELAQRVRHRVLRTEAVAENRGPVRVRAVALAVAVFVPVLVVAAIVLTSGSDAPRPAPSSVSATSAPLVRILGVLRRAQASADLDPEITRLLDRPGQRALGLQGTPVRSLIRLATTTPWGQKVFLVPYRQLTTRQIAKLPRPRRPVAQRHQRLRGPGDTLGVFAGGGGCCSTARMIEQSGSYTFGAAGPGAPTRFVEVVPDGVAKVSLLLPRQDYATGPIYPRALIATRAVHKNVFAVEVNRSEDDLGTRQIWYGPTGTIIKRIGATTNADLNHVVLPPTPAPATTLSRRAERDPSTPNPVTITPKTGGPHTTFTVMFRSLLNNASYLYRLYGPGGTGCRGRAQLTYGWENPGPSAIRGQIVRNPYSHPGNGNVLVNGRYQLPNWCPGTFRITVSAAATSPSGAPGPGITPFGSATFVVH
jgi:hypothetical protein